MQHTRKVMLAVMPQEQHRRHTSIITRSLVMTLDCAK